MRASARILALLAWVLAALAQDTTRVFFVGNSHTYVNDLPGLVRGLALARGHVLLTGQSTPGGYSLRQHAQLPATLEGIAQGGWDWVVLQEQSQIPAIPCWRDAWMTPAATRLDSLARSTGAATLLYMTWGWRDGGLQCLQDSCVQYQDYFHMQDSVSVAYGSLGRRLQAEVAPAGAMFARVMRADPFAELWAEDGYHPSLEGSYLAACTFLQRLFGESPLGLPHPDGISDERALWLQERVAEELAALPEPRPTRLEMSLAGWPNPFNPSLTLSWTLERSAQVRLDIHDAGGRRVARLLDGTRPAGGQSLTWRPDRLPSGRYWARLVVDGHPRATLPLTLAR